MSLLIGAKVLPVLLCCLFCVRSVDRWIMTLSGQLTLLAYRGINWHRPLVLCGVLTHITSSATNSISNKNVPCRFQGCKNMAHSIFWLEVIKGRSNHGVVCFVSWGNFFVPLSCLGYIWCFISLFLVGYQCSRLLGKTRLWNDLLCVEWDVKPYTHFLTNSRTQMQVECRQGCHSTMTVWSFVCVESVIGICVKPQ